MPRRRRWVAPCSSDKAATSTGAEAAWCGAGDKVGCTCIDIIVGGYVASAMRKYPRGK